MTAPTRADLESRAQRALRRGDLRTAIALLESLCGALPHDSSLRQRLEDVRSALQPDELSQPAQAPLDDHPRPAHALEQAEAHASLGDLPAALALYRSAQRSQPENTLLEERLLELAALAGVGAQAPAELRPQLDSRTLLEALLVRVQARRRAP